MKFYKTITVTSKGFEDSEYDLKNPISSDDIRHENVLGEIIRLDTSTINSYDILCHAFSKALWEAKYRADFVYHKHYGDILPDTNRFSVLIPHIYVSGINPGAGLGSGGADERLSRVEDIIKRLRPVGQSTQFDLYEYYLSDEQLASSPEYEYIWPFKDEYLWEGDGDYITVDMPPGHNPDYNDRAKWEGGVIKSPQFNKVMRKVEELCPLKVEYCHIDNFEGEDTEDLIELMKHSKRHFTYKTGTVVLAGMMNIPTICYGPTNGKPQYLKSTYFITNNLTPGMKYQSLVHRDNELFDRLKKINVRTSMWNKHIKPSRVNQLKIDPKTGRTAIVQEPQRYLIEACSPKELTEFVKGERDVRVELAGAEI